MLKFIVGLFGLLEALYPDRVIAVFTDLSYDYDGETPTPKPWIITAARIEGFILLAVAIRAAIKADWAADDAETAVSESTDEPESTNTVDRI